ncbi:MAG: hypothetical protein Tsb0015_04730 [Simkaniaceae bacterium]
MGIAALGLSNRVFFSSLKYTKEIPLPFGKQLINNSFLLEKDSVSKFTKFYFRGLDLKEPEELAYPPPSSNTSDLFEAAMHAMKGKAKTPVLALYAHHPTKGASLLKAWEVSPLYRQFYQQPPEALKAFPKLSSLERTQRAFEISLQTLKELSS